MESFAQRVNAWYKRGHRDLPWRRTKDPYRIWISEIMLQQTRAETVIPYYKRFLEIYPDVFALASCDETELLKAWEGLGYYSRARNLRRTARIIADQYNGKMPDNIATLRKLPGIGPYTAGAIASIAYRIPAAAVDGNFERVFCRYTGETTDPSLPATRKAIWQKAERWVPKEEPDVFANAMMELGACICTPKAPSCADCPLREDCKAYAQGMPESYPIKLSKKKLRTESRQILLLLSGKEVLVIKRKERLLKGLYVFPDLVSDFDLTKIYSKLEDRGIKAIYVGSAGTARHVFTHLIWEMEIHIFRCLKVPINVKEDELWADVEQLKSIPMPTAVRRAREVALERLANRNG